VGSNGQTDSEVAHEHVLSHSGDYWERRPGFCDRYQWLLVRKNLSELFKMKVHEEVRKAVLISLQSFLEERQMWPFPAGTMSKNWLDEVRASTLPEEKKIQILQNEFIFRHQAVDQDNSNLIAHELRNRNARVLTTLDIRNEAEGMRAEGLRNALRPVQLEAQLMPIFNDDPRIPPGIPREFGNFGNMYLVRDLVPFEDGGPLQTFILSGRASRKMTHNKAEAHCASLGGTLPTVLQLRSLIRAMRDAQGRYNPNLIANMAGHWFWLAERKDAFSGDNGQVMRTHGGVQSVRCVIPLPHPFANEFANELE
jgi:hypothetical protein